MKQNQLIEMSVSEVESTCGGLTLLVTRVDLTKTLIIGDKTFVRPKHETTVQIIRDTPDTPTV